MSNSYASQFYLKEDGRSTPPPPFRRLLGFAFDPSLSLRLETASITLAVFEILWEDELKPGPIGEYIEVVDYDPASGCWYEPVDLNATEVLAQDGIAPSEGNPQFHQQMVYVVAMNTVRHFERALGRPIFWASNYDDHAPTGQRDRYIQRLRIYSPSRLAFRQGKLGIQNPKCR